MQGAPAGRGGHAAWHAQQPGADCLGGDGHGRFTEACRKADVQFSITVKLYKGLHKMIAAIEEKDWAPIPYWIGDGADVAETSYRPFFNKHPEVRLIIRRVKPTPGSQLALFATYDYHAFITNREGDMIELEADHRRHAVRCV